MGATQDYQPRDEKEANELATYNDLWKTKGLDFTHFEENHEKRAGFIRMALKRGSPVKPSDFGKLNWYGDGACY